DEEYPWLLSLKPQLETLTVPIEASQFLENVLEPTLQNQTQKHKPPANTPAALLQLLRQLGIVEIRSDKRINIPEIYLYGFGVKRKGGVKRPK
ncbi:MAG: hypothetical protein ACKO5Q_02745, partial [Microcystaceae cyanobacterium]